MGNQTELSGKQGVHGTNEPVPHRETGHEETHPVSVTDDEGTEKRRAHYGDTPKYFYGPKDFSNELLLTGNDLKSVRNPTKQDAIQNNDGFYNHTGAG